MRNSYLFTSESVSEGHPDKVADQISDAIVDLFLSKDPEARVACETMTTTNRVVLAKLTASGTFDELVERGGAFAELARAQFLTGTAQEGAAQANAGEAASAAE